MFVIFGIISMYARAVGPRYYRFSRVTYGTGNTSLFSRYWRRRQLRMRRRDALRYAKAFVSPYKSIFGKLTLSNKYCKIRFTTDKKTQKFFCMSKEYNSKNEFPFFEAKCLGEPVWNEEFFNSLCFNFSYNTRLENLHHIFTTNQFLLDDKNYDVSKPVQKVKPTKETPTQDSPKINPAQAVLEQLNINEATEAELTALPGINIVMAKKIIKQRDYKGEFKSVNDFIKFLKIKPHFEKQLRQMITVKPIEQKNVSKGERILDIE